MTTLPSRVGDRGRSIVAVAGLAALVLALIPGSVLAADWSRPVPVATRGGPRLDSLHQLSADGGRLHLIHPRVGPREMDDRVLYQRSSDGRRWSRARTLFSATRRHRQVVPNLALAARDDVIAVAWRTSGPRVDTLWVRVSRDGGRRFGAPRALVSAGPKRGIGVPAVAVMSRRDIAVAWTDRSDGRVLVRLSRDGGRDFGKVRTLGRTGLSIDCQERVSDGLVGLTASSRRLYAAWSEAPAGRCLASSIVVRGSADRGRTWGRELTVTDRTSYGWPELGAQGHRVVATVQAPDGGIIVARSSDDGRRWSSRLLRAPEGRNYSAADVLLLRRGRVMIAFVDERLRDSRLVSTRVVSRWSPDGGARFNPAIAVTSSGPKLRLAANIAILGRRPVIVMQSGPLSGSPRYILASRLR